MKARLVLMSSLLVLAGCGDKSTNSTTTNTTSSSGSPLTAPVDYLAAAAKAQQSAVKTVDVTSLDKAIQLFNVDQGRNPKDLNELVPKYLKSIPAPPPGMKFDYNPTTGEVKVVPN